MAGLLDQADPMALLPTQQSLLGPVFANPLMMRQMGRISATQPPKLGGPQSWGEYGQMLNQNLQQNFPTNPRDPNFNAAIKNVANTFAPMGMTVKINPSASQIGEVMYQGGHKPPSKTYGAPLHDLTAGDLIPADIYSKQAARYYGTGDTALDAETLRLFAKYRGTPDAEVSIYRAVPKNAPDSINAGDWVTINKSYAAMHGDGPLSGDYKIVEKKVPAKSLWGSLDSIHEFGYHPE